MESYSRAPVLEMNGRENEMKYCRKQYHHQCHWLPAYIRRHQNWTTISVLCVTDFRPLDLRGKRLKIHHNKIAFYLMSRPTTRDCVYLLGRGHFRSRDKDGGNTIQFAIAEKTHGARKLFGCVFYRTGVIAECRLMHIHTLCLKNSGHIHDRSPRCV